MKREDIAINMAQKWLKEAKKHSTYRSKKNAKRISRLIKDPKSKAFLVDLLDQTFRTDNAKRIHNQIEYLLKKHGAPKAFSLIERLGLKTILLIGKLAPKPIVHLFRGKLRLDTNHLILPLEKEKFDTHLTHRQNQGFTVNINLIGEEVISESDAKARLDDLLSLLERPSVTYLSVKISSILSQFPPLGFDETVTHLSNRLSILYQKAASYTPNKFINLDMESYHDLHLTLAAFKNTLNQPQFKNVYAGIVLQTYLPDALNHLKDLVSWSEDRIKTGRSPIKVRLVKGANLQMEQVISERENIANPVLPSKEEVDANFKHIMHYISENDRMKAVHIGLASQNCLELAYGWSLVQENQLQDYFTFELLEGMAAELAHYLNQNIHKTLLYTPVVSEKNFYYALSYLFRRLDENTGPKNYLNHAENLPKNQQNWSTVCDIFKTSTQILNTKTLSNEPRRSQNRREEEKTPPTYPDAFQNTDTTDFFLPHHIEWAKSIRKKWHTKTQDPIQNLSIDAIQTAIKTAKQDPDNWRQKPESERVKIIKDIAKHLNLNRGDLLGQAALEVGKLFTESDVEVTEAIDFALYYPESLEKLDLPESISKQGKGVVLVVAPWNFPIAIPLGGVVSALVSGNTVLLKPAPESVHTAFLLAECCWKAGVPTSALQVIPTDDTKALNKLTAAPEINHIIFTGSTETGRRIKANTPTTSLSAETGGKNVMYVSDICDTDLVIRDILQSAFSNAGQKCSACSLVFLHKDHVNDAFLTSLSEAASSLQCGSPWDFSADMGPLVAPVSDTVQSALTLENNEYWLLEPLIDSSNPKYITPGIKMNLTPDSFMFNTELFAPILGIVPVESIEVAIQFANQIPYGLTSGIWSLDTREHDLWESKIQAGNIYINRGTTGAIVQRQPFGGIKASSLGTGIKAGGPNYVTQFTSFTNQAALSVDDILKDYHYQMTHFFNKREDVSQIFGEKNNFRYTPNQHIYFRIEPDDNPESVRLILEALQITNNPIKVSLDSNANKDLKDWAKHYTIDITHESFDDLLNRLDSMERLRLSKPLKNKDQLHRIANSSVTLMDSPPSASGRLELLHYLNEQAISYAYHRYGNVSSHLESSPG